MKRGIVLILLFVSFFYGYSQSTANYKIKFLEVNKNNSDYGVAILDENKLIFTSADELEKGSKKNFNPRKELFIGDIDHDGEIINIERVTKKENNKFNTTGIAYTSDFKTVYFSRNKYLRKRSKQRLAKNQRLELYKADVDAEGNWINIQRLPFNKEKISTGHPVLSEDNKRLYFVSDRLPSQGKTDIFYVDILSDGSYGIPQNLGQKVNTAGVETTPFLANGNILYFSSDGHQGDGNLDVFAVELYKDSTTSEVYHLAAPINSINDDFAYIVNKDNNQGFFTSNRLQGKGYNDLYSFILEEDVRPGKCFISVDGKVKDKDTQETIPGATVELYDLDGSLVQSATTFDDGTYNFTVSCANEFKLVASNKEYNNDEKIIEILKENYHKALHANLHLSKIQKEKKGEFKSLEPIYFGFDKAVITESAASEMDRIVSLMKDNPQLIIEASAFTDSQGSNAYNVRLSNRRANATVDYLKSHGIDSKRIRARGYGEERLVNECVNGVECDDSKHQMNRRTEFNFVNIQASRSDQKKAVTRKKYLATNETSLTNEKKKKKKENKKKVNKIPPKRKKRSITSSKTRYAVDDTQLAQANKNAIVESEANDQIEKDAKSEVKKESIKKTAIANNDNKALNYIEEEKIKMIDKYDALEKKFELAILEYADSADSLKSEKMKIAEYKEMIESTEEIGWSNIIEYKNKLIQFNKKYKSFTNPEESSSNGEIIIIGETEPSHGVKIGNDRIIEQLRPINDYKQKGELSENDKNDKKILEENLRIKNMEVIAMRMNSRGKYLETHIAKKTELIKIKFKLLKNNKIASGPKEAHIVLQNPNGKVAQAKGVFKVKKSNKQTKFTDHSTINYNKNDVDVVLYIQRKGKNYEKGIYPIKLFLEGQLVAVSNLDLEKNM